MLYELRTYTVKPGSLGDMVKAASTLARDIRKDDFRQARGRLADRKSAPLRDGRARHGAMPISANAPDCAAPLAKIRAGLASIFR